VTVQDHTGRLVYANERGARLSGYSSPSELLQAPVGDFLKRFEVLDASGVPVSVEMLPGRLAVARGYAEATLRVRDRFSGAVRWSEVRSYAVRAEDNALFIVNVFRDVTEIIEQQRLLEEQAEELEQQTVQAQALAEELEQTNEELLTSLRDAEDARALAEDREQWLSRLHSLTMLLSRAMEPEAVTEIAMGPGAEAFDANGVALSLYGDDEPEAATTDEVVVESRIEPTSLTTPIRVGGRTIGVMTFTFSRPREFSSDYVSMAKTFGKELGLALDRTRTRAELERARRAAEAASDAKSAFLATMSHEIRTPINAILGFTDLLQLGVAAHNPALQSDYLQRVRRSTEHLLELINDVLDLSKIESGTLTVTRESSPALVVVNEAVALIRNAATERQIQLEMSCGESLAYVGDALRVRQILLNLLSNAVKFSHRGGVVRLDCRVRPGSESRIEFAVIDRGIGIEASSLEAIFDPFMQAERGYTRTHGGTGLGLSISRQLARLMDGDVTVNSTVGKGSTFTLTLPHRLA
jgi:PAS domain S-box-containing protein